MRRGLSGLSGPLRTPIFARDALTVKLIEGRKTYHGLLEEAKWMKVHFPALYDIRVLETDSEGRGASSARAGARPAVLNQLLYHTVGSFLRMKSWALNRKFAKFGRRWSEFETRIGPDHCIYESNKYRRLGRMYLDIASSSR